MAAPIDAANNSAAEEVNQELANIDSRHDNDARLPAQPSQRQSQSARSHTRSISKFSFTAAIIVYVVFYIAYLCDVFSLFLLLMADPANIGGGLFGCDCDDLESSSECQLCWNCEYSTSTTPQSCTYFKPEMTKLLTAYIIPILAACSGIGWFLNELTIWIRICMLCHTLGEESKQSQHRREVEDDEFILDNAVDGYFPVRQLKRSKTANAAHQKTVIHRQETLKKYESRNRRDRDVLGLVPCCFEDVDAYHVKVVLLQHTQNERVLHQVDMEQPSNNESSGLGPGDIGEKCLEFPCFAFSFSLSMCWLIPFRYFWLLAVCDLSSKFWKRICWFSLFHALCFDCAWIVVLKSVLHVVELQDNTELADMETWLWRKLLVSVVMMAVIVSVWIIVCSCVCANKGNRNRRQNSSAVYSPIRHDL